MDRAEKAKWDAYYETVATQAIPAEVEEFGRELRRWFESLIPKGPAKILEAACGAGWQSAALAECGRFDVHLMDFSENALQAARRTFQQRGVAATFQLGDVFEPGQPGFDLVFNAGVIEHYSFEDQVRMVRAMASRSRGLVVVLAPNAGCYWYWVSRLRHAKAGNWPFGLETPVTSLGEVFAAAGLHPVDERYMGRAWTELMIRGLPEISPALVEVMSACHRDGVVPDQQSCYLTGYAGSVGEYAAGQQDRSGYIADSLRSIAADALALRLASDAKDAAMHLEIEALKRDLEEARSASWQRAAVDATDQRKLIARRLQDYYDGIRDYRSKFEVSLARLQSQRAWKLMVAVRKAYDHWVRRGFAGKLRAVGLLAGAPFGAAADTSDQEPEWPDVRAYLPPQDSLDSLACREEIPAARKYDVLVLSIIDFDFRYQRPQHVAAQLAARGHRVWWVSPMRFLAPDSARAYHVRDLRAGVWEVELRGPRPDIYHGELTADDVHQLAASLGELYRDLAIAENAVLVQLPFWRKLAAALHGAHHSVVAYDCMDEWDAFENIGDFNRREEKSLVRECDVLFVSSERLSTKFRNAGVSPVLVRNAVDYEFFQNARQTVLLDSTRHPVIGYFGAIADWIDLDLIERVARERPAYSFVLIGEVFGRDVSRLERLPNVRLLGDRPYAKMPSYLREFDVCIIPFLLNEVTAATDPVKLYEYLSLGHPVVTTNMAELQRCAGLIYFAANAREFVLRLDEALAEDGSELRPRRIEFARNNTWQGRAAVMDETISARFPKVSVIIVTENSERYIGPCLDSLWHNATYPSMEVIVFDNASTDGIREFLTGKASRWPGLTCEFSERKLESVAAMNEAVACSTGQYIAFLHADTMVTPGWLGRLAAHLRSAPNLGLVCPVTNAAPNDVKAASSHNDAESMEGFALETAKAHRGRRTAISVAPLSCTLTRAAFLAEIGGLDPLYEGGMFADDDLAEAVRARGLEVAMAEDCFVHHFDDDTRGARSGAEYERLFRKNRERFERKWGHEWTPGALGGVT